ncbi:MAG: hypothetical protein ACRCTA_00260 [Bacilli bacterium]
MAYFDGKPMTSASDVVCNLHSWIHKYNGTVTPSSKSSLSDEQRQIIQLNKELKRAIIVKYPITVMCKVLEVTRSCYYKVIKQAKAINESIDQHHELDKEVA